MALSAELEGLLNLIQDPAQREARRKELVDLTEGSLRQSDYSRKMNELTVKERDLAEKHQKNLKWYETADKQYRDAMAELRTSQEKIAALEAAQAHGSDTVEGEDELAAQLKLARAEAEAAKAEVNKLNSTVQGINKMVEEGKLITAEKLNAELTTRGNALGAALLEIYDLQEQCRKEYGVEIDRKALLEEADKLGGDLKKAYDSVTAKQREEKLRKDITAQVEKEFREKHKNDTVPYAEGAPPTLGPLQSRLQKKDTGIPDDVPADGSGRLANLVAAELRAEGKV